MDGTLSSVRRRSLRKYLSILGSDSVPEHTSYVTNAVLQRCRDRGVFAPPVLLSQVAGDFLIEPVPFFRFEFTSIASIGFDENRERFIIGLDPSDTFERAPLGAIQAELPFSSSDPPFELCLTNRGRYSYAHEVAHRFFFVNFGGKWRRAANMAVQSLDEPWATKVLLHLQQVEERACNSIARKVLVPSELLSSFVYTFARIAVPSGTTIIPILDVLIRELVRRFAVPVQTAIWALGDAMRSGEIEVPAGLFAVCLGASVRGSSGLHKLDTVRIEASLGTSLHNGQRWKSQGAWKSETCEFGSSFHDFCVRLLSSVSPKRKRNVRVPVVLRGGDANSTLELRGWWSPLVKAHTYETTFRRGLLWGQLHDYSDDASNFQPRLPF